jgi:predicted amidophosphoribosyltransferase
VTFASGGAAVAEERAETEVAAASVDESKVEEGPIEVATAVTGEMEEGVCPQCGNQLRPGIAFCGKCGYGLEGAEAEDAEVEAAVECPQCGHTLKPGIQFCGKCGYRLGEEEPARPAAEEPVEEEEEPTEQGSVDVEETLEGESPVDTKGGAECPQCGKPVEEEWQVCPYCGTGLASECPECGKATEPDWVACPFCGAALKDR